MKEERKRREEGKGKGREREGRERGKKEEEKGGSCQGPPHARASSAYSDKNAMILAIFCVAMGPKADKNHKVFLH